MTDTEEPGKLDASEIHARRPSAKEITKSKKGENSYSQSQMERENLLG